MGARDTSTQRGIFEIVFYVFVVGFIISLATFSGFALGGFEESFFSNLIEINSYLGSYIIYIPLLIVALIVIIFPLMNMRFIRDGEHPATQEGAGWLRIFTVSYLYNPEDSFLWFLAGKFKSLKQIKWSTNIMRVIFLSIIIFGFLGLLQIFVPQSAISGVPPPAQQISVTSDVVFGAGIPSVGENGSLLFILFFLLGIDAFICAKFIKGKDMQLMVFFTIALLIIAPFMGYIWMSYHSIVYGNSEASLQATFVFGWLGSTLIIFTGIFIWWLVWHIINNLMQKLIDVVTIKEDLAIIVGLILFFVIILYFVFEFFQAKKRKRSREELITE